MACLNEIGERGAGDRVGNFEVERAWAETFQAGAFEPHLFDPLKRLPDF